MNDAQAKNDGRTGCLARIYPQVNNKHPAASRDDANLKQRIAIIAFTTEQAHPVGHHPAPDGQPRLDVNLGEFKKSGLTNLKASVQ
jgi:hypothetical protein